MFIIDNSSKVETTKYLPTAEELNKMWYEHSLVFNYRERNEVLALTHIIMWVSPEKNYVK